MNNTLFVADIQSICNEKNQCIGHWFAFAQMYQQLFAGISKVVVAGGDVYEPSFGNNNFLLLPFNVNEGTKHFEILRRFIINAIELFKQAKGQTIVLQYGSPFSTHIAALLAYKKCNLYLIEYSTDGIRGVVRSFVWSLLKKKVKGIICPNDEIGKSFGVPYCVVPDYIYTGDIQNTSIAFEEKLFDFCIIGRLNEDKGVVETINALKNKECKLLIAGNPDSDSYKSEIQNAIIGAPNITLDLGFLPKEKYDHYIKYSKFAILNYQEEYSNRSSGVVFDMLFAGVPVIGHKCKSLEFIEDMKMGILFDNIELFKPEIAYDERIYNMYINNIIEYRRLHKMYKEKLLSFFNN